MSQITIPIKGMHCRSCEILLEDKISGVLGVKRVKCNYKKNLALIGFEGEERVEEIIKIIEAAGYLVGKSEKPVWISRRKEDYFNLFKAGLTVLILYLIIRQLGLSDVSFDAGDKTGPAVAFVVGLVAGVSTCMALIGGLVLGFAARHAELHPSATAKEKFKPHLYFNLGRIIGFAVLGGLIGFVGSAFKLSAGFLGWVTVLVGAVMIILGLKLIEIFPILHDKTITLPKFIYRFLGVKREEKEYSHRGAMLEGALTFFLPCGFTQAMQLYAVSTGSVFQGALIMSLFAFGTSAGLLGIGWLSSLFRGKRAKVFYAVAGLAVILLGLFNITNARHLIFQGSFSNNKTNQSDEVQEIRMTQYGSGYSPNFFTVKKDVKVRWVINSTNPYSCASSLVVPKYHISQYLKKGENIIEFTPTETGEIHFSCSMGMYRGIIKVE
ncbi:MAG: sulfite exporter TauE/SafE family protein [Candidatus Magasanikbacteria bacterium]|nr:sulfite exporter TauE/SafE family protein [Candidatus Magasanikbacteria bacterium]